MGRYFDTIMDMLSIDTNALANIDMDPKLYST